ncbi:3-oxoacyl-[acyl-carrier-protein] reductase FabG-like [Galleria mellonella]|uniref:3-oxoacyl-[acyl-carrier-protein] reductase FabG-like n=1 Tax=Galleria mellonella TaxID=7137 RepID=A0A6J1WLY6_GALME|nr:3-oxoacyl-[acyl-carrier-protein] reductase FabG-like [Galleria mellonella]
MSFSGKVVLITGASAGIGAVTAISFAREGADVAIVGRNEDKLKQVVQECKRVGRTPLPIKADVANDDDAKRIVNETIKKFGKLDVLVNNAGIGAYGSILSGEILKAYDDIMGINVRAVIHLTSLAAPHLVKTKGNIVNISSAAGFRVSTSPPQIAYCVSKAAVNHFTAGAALELASSGVRVNAVNPGPTRTDFLQTADAPITWDDFKGRTALGRVSEPEEVADLILYVASDKARGITGTTLLVDNGRVLM